MFFDTPSKIYLQFNSDFLLHFDSGRSCSQQHFKVPSAFVVLTFLYPCISLGSIALSPPVAIACKFSILTVVIFLDNFVKSILTIEHTEIIPIPTIINNFFFIILHFNNKLILVLRICFQRISNVIFGKFYNLSSNNNITIKITYFATSFLYYERVGGCRQNFRRAISTPPHFQGLFIPLFLHYYTFQYYYIS